MCFLCPPKPIRWNWSIYSNFGWVMFLQSNKVIKINIQNRDIDVQNIIICCPKLIEKMLHWLHLFMFRCNIVDPPRVLSAGPDRLTTAPLYSPAAFECVGEGNPPPSYKWYQRWVNIVLVVHTYTLKLYCMNNKLQWL